MHLFCQARLRQFHCRKGEEVKKLLRGRRLRLLAAAEDGCQQQAPQAGVDQRLDNGAGGEDRLGSASYHPASSPATGSCLTGNNLESSDGTRKALDLDQRIGKVLSLLGEHQERFWNAQSPILYS